ncbi:16S rRNA (cytidine(1402)-2'-O)-methyltransferase [Aestuariivirga sp.]|uniref:16S rRNA (cytidine(1402)-2'-O)-methyltransferase n=1 Tax=Aestuariivirga sp. TaxID=2650926 RepID=UPI0039E5AFAB
MTDILQKPPRRYAIGAAVFEPPNLAPGLYIVGTPIGNLGDITIRALEALAAADVILCEDTRNTGKLLERFAIRAKLEPYHEHNAAKVRPGILARLSEGARFALVSDAGMPLVNDPGYRLVAEAVAARIAVTCCPGPVAAIAGLALAGLPTDRFGFFGFVPQKQGERQKLWAELSSLRSTLIFYESPHRIIETLQSIAETFPGRLVAVARELTKLHEEILRGTASEVAATLAARPAVKGEITLLIGPPAEGEGKASAEDLEAAIAEVSASLPASKAAAEIAKRFGLPKKDIYARILAAKAEADGE